MTDNPITEEYRAKMNSVAKTLDEVFNGDKRHPDKETGFVLLTFKYNNPDNNINYISNGAERPTMIGVLRDTADRLESQAVAVIEEPATPRDSIVKGHTSIENAWRVYRQVLRNAGLTNEQINDIRLAFWIGASCAYHGVEIAGGSGRKPSSSDHQRARVIGDQIKCFDATVNDQVAQRYGNDLNKSSSTVSKH